MADFSLLQQPGFAAAALSGYQAGAAIGKERRTQEALAGVDLARPETIMPVLSADPQMGSALLTASTAMAKAQREGEARSAMGDYIISRLSGKGGSANTSSAPATSITAGGMADSQPGDIVVTAPTQQETPEQRLAKADPEGFMKLQEQFGKFDDNQREALKEQQDAIASVAQQARSMPLAQRATFIQSQAGFLQGHHVDPATIANFDPSDANIDAVVAQSLGVKGMLERGDKDRTYSLQREKFAHDVAHDDATLAVSRGNLAVSQGNLALSRQREGRVAAGKGGSGGGSGASGMPAPTSRAAYDALPAGTRYRAPDGSVRTK